MTFYLDLITVKTTHQLRALSLQTYIFAAITAAVFLLLAIIIANSIRFEGGANPKDHGKRRLWFWLLLFVCFSTFFLYNKFLVEPKIQGNLQSRFITVSILASLVAAATYLLLGFILSKIFSTGKIGNWFKFK